jgi:hypothetical protein
MMSKTTYLKRKEKRETKRADEIADLVITAIEPKVLRGDKFGFPARQALKSRIADVLLKEVVFIA